MFLQSGEFYDRSGLMGNVCVTLQPIKWLNASFQLKGKRARLEKDISGSTIH